MIKSKYVHIYMMIVMFFSFSAKASATIYLQASLVDVIQVTTGTDAATYYLMTNGGWKPGSGYTEQAAGCPTPTYATIKNSQVGATELLTIALAAKTTKQPVTLVGTCGTHEAYFEISQIIY